MSDRILGTMYFSASAGGSILWDDLFWFFGHPEVYVVLLPAFGLIAEIFPVFSGRPLAEKNIILICTGADSHPAQLHGLVAPHVHHRRDPQRG